MLVAPFASTRRWLAVAAVASLLFALTGCDLVDRLPLAPRGAPAPREPQAPPPAPTPTPEPQPTWYPVDAGFHVVADDGDDRVLLTNAQEYIGWRAGEVLWTRPAPTQIGSDVITTFADAEHFYVPVADSPTGRITTIQAFSWDTGEVAWRLDVAAALGCANPESMVLTTSDHVNDEGLLTGLYFGTGTRGFNGDCTGDFPSDPTPWGVAINPKNGRPIGEPLLLPGDGILTGYAFNRDGSALYLHLADGMGASLHRYDLTKGTTQGLGLNQFLQGASGSGLGARMTELDDNVLYMGWESPVTGGDIPYGFLNVDEWGAPGRGHFTDIPRGFDTGCFDNVVRTQTGYRYCLYPNLMSIEVDGGYTETNGFFFSASDAAGAFAATKTLALPAGKVGGNDREDADFDMLPALVPPDAAGRDNPLIVLPGDGGSVIAYDATTGEEVWRAGTPDAGLSASVYAVPALGEVYFIDKEAQTTTVLDAATGAEVDTIALPYEPWDQFAPNHLFVNAQDKAFIRALE